MANTYATAGDVAARVPSVDVAVTDDVLEAMSRWIDGFCGFRRFWLDPTVTPRLYAACDPYVLHVHEIGSATGVIVATDDGSGTFATTVAASDYQLEPVNAAYAVPGPAPFTRIRSLSAMWPRAYFGNSRLERVRVTARYGWPAVPSVVKEWCIILTVDHFENPSSVRSESIDGYSVSYGAVKAAEKALSQFRRALVA